MDEQHPSPQPQPEQSTPPVQPAPPLQDIKPVPAPTIPAEPTVSELAGPPQEIAVEPAQPQQTADTPVNSSPPVDNEPQAPAQSAVPPNSTPAKLEKKRPIILIVVAIIVALLLAVAAVFIYLNRNKTGSKDPNASTAAATSPALQAVSKITS